MDKIGSTGRYATKDTEMERSSSLSGHEQEAIFVEATIILEILAKAGSPFVKELLQDHVLPPLWKLLCGGTSSAALVTAILKTLIAMADRLPPLDPSCWEEDSRLRDMLYSEECIGGIVNIVAQPWQPSVYLAVSLLVKTCSTEKHREASTASGLLEALATKIASFVVTQGLVLPDPHDSAHSYPSSSRALPRSAPPEARLAPFLNLAATVIDASRTRAERFLSSTAFTMVFPKPQMTFSPTDIKKTPWSSASYLSGGAVPRHRHSNPINSLLPTVPVPSARKAADQAHFPPLSCVAPISKKGTSFLSPPLSLGVVEDEDPADDEEEHPAIAWLIYLTRTEAGANRIMAAKLLTILFRRGLVQRSRFTMLGMLLVPLLVSLLAKDSELEHSPEIADLDPSASRWLKAEAPRLLSLLIMDSLALRKAAVHCDAIKRLVQLLKESFDKVPADRNPLWCPVKRTWQTRQHSPKLGGAADPSMTARRLMRYRANILQALASLAVFEDEYRKSICDLGVVPYIIESLTPYVPKSPFPETHQQSNHTHGNSPEVLVAACATAQALTRSVSVLRTSLIDADVAPPLFRLLSNPDLEVRTAATKVICNLALTFSPMREAIASQGIIKILCKHAHTAHAMLRLDSLWALKQLVLHSAHAVKINVIQDLTPTWIKHLMATEPEDITPGTIIGMGISHQNGEKAVPRMGEALIDSAMTENPASLGRNPDDGQRSDDPACMNAADSPTHRLKHDILIQAQVVDLIRNMIIGESAATMASYIFQEMGQDDFFAILAQLLRPHPASHRRKTTEPPDEIDLSKCPAPRTELTISIGGVIVHIAAASPRYRSLLISQTELMELVLPMFTHSNRDVRLNAAWITTNLLFHESPEDKVECRRGARELERLGFVDRVMALQSDPDLDIKETTKTTLTFFADLLHG